MKRTVAIALVLMLIIGAMPVAALASSTYNVYHTTASALNIRSGPGTKYSKVGSALARGTEVYSINSSGNWRRVRVLKTGSKGGKVSVTGWVSKSYLSSNGRAKVATNHDPLVVRSGPGTGYRKRGVLPRNSRVTFSKVCGNWAYVSGRGLSGWSSLTYLMTLNWYNY